MIEEDTVNLTFKEVLVLKEWFRFVAMYSQIEERDRKLVDKLRLFEEEMLLKMKEKMKENE